MDEILAFLLIAFGTLGVFIGIPFLFIFLISSWTAYSRTIKWQKEKEKRIAAAEPDVEMDRLVSEDEEEEPLDSEDEAEINARKEETEGRLESDILSKVEGGVEGELDWYKSKKGGGEQGERRSGETGEAGGEGHPQVRAEAGEEE